MAKYKTKNERLIAITEAYRKIVNRPWTTGELALWAMAHDLYPCPKRGCSIEDAENWERKLEAATNAT